MFIAHKSNQILSIDEKKWDCRRKAKEIKTFAEYWTWEPTITSGDPPVITYPSEDFSIVECTDENVQERLVQLSDYVSNTIEGTTYNIKYYVSKRDSEIDGVNSHFIGDNTAKVARLLADKWENVRSQRDRKLAETDYLALSDNTLATNMKKYRQDLRDVPTQSDPDDITWPTKP